MGQRVVPVAAARQEFNLDKLRRRRGELEERNRELALAAVRGGKTPTVEERRAIQANIEEIRSIKATLRAFGCLYQ
ncbi:hypothetical protein HY635_03305 [Candidatus Uhrbacteria bacterium]|nr:hypothetical protein [Candidatus Uhrbacteria bacterium]